MRNLIPTILSAIVNGLSFSRLGLLLRSNLNVRLTQLPRHNQNTPCCSPHRVCLESLWPPKDGITRKSRTRCTGAENSLGSSNSRTCGSAECELARMLVDESYILYTCTKKIIIKKERREEWSFGFTCTPQTCPESWDNTLVSCLFCSLHVNRVFIRDAASDVRWIRVFSPWPLARETLKIEEREREVKDRIVDDRTELHTFLNGFFF